MGAGGEGGGRDRGGPEPGLSHPCPSDSSTEALTLNLTEVVKRQNPKSKKGFNQVRMPPPPRCPLRRHTGHVCVCVCMSVYACVCLCVWGWRVQGLCWAVWVRGEAGKGCAHVWGPWEEEVPLHLQKGSVVAARGTPSGLRVRVDSASGNPGSHSAGSGVFLPEQLVLLDSGKGRGWEGVRA